MIRTDSAVYCNHFLKNKKICKAVERQRAQNGFRPSGFVIAHPAFGKEFYKPISSLRL